MVWISTTFPAKSLMVKVSPVRASVIGMANQSGRLGVGTSVGTALWAEIAGTVTGIPGVAEELHADKRRLVSKTVKILLGKRILLCIVHLSSLLIWESGS
jgi:hypothetical protein